MGEAVALGREQLQSRQPPFPRLGLAQRPEPAFLAASLRSRSLMVAGALAGGPPSSASSPPLGAQV